MLIAILVVLLIITFLLYKLVINYVTASKMQKNHYNLLIKELQKLNDRTEIPRPGMRS